MANTPERVEYGCRAGHELRVVLRNLTEREIARIGGEGGVDHAVFLEPAGLRLLADFEGVILWPGGPYSWHSLLEAERVLPPPLTDGELAELTIVLMDGTNGIARAVRPPPVAGVLGRAPRRRR
jgi:hypothetical protein